jgi:dynein heavy chain
VKQLHAFLNDSPQGEIPYKALRYLVGECNYGGRVTDEWDRHALVCILERFLSPAVLQPGCALSSSGQYSVPPDGPLASYLDAIKALPPTAPPEVFGLHENADITKEQKETNELFASILLTEARQSSETAEGKRNDVVGEIVADILRRLPARFNVDVVSSKYPMQHSESMNTVLVQECLRYNRLTDVIRSSLANLVKVGLSFCSLSSLSCSSHLLFIVVCVGACRRDRHVG